MGCEHCELSSDGAVARFSSIWGGVGTDKEGPSGLVREATVSTSSWSWTVRGKVVGAVSSRIWSGTLHIGYEDRLGMSRREEASLMGAGKFVGAESVPLCNEM